MRRPAGRCRRRGRGRELAVGLERHDGRLTTVATAAPNSRRAGPCSLGRPRRPIGPDDGEVRVGVVVVCGRPSHQLHKSLRPGCSSVTVHLPTVSRADADADAGGGEIQFVPGRRGGGQPARRAPARGGPHAPRRVRRQTRPRRRPRQRRRLLVGQPVSGIALGAGDRVMFQDQQPSVGSQHPPCLGESLRDVGPQWWAVASDHATEADPSASGSASAVPST